MIPYESNSLVVNHLNIAVSRKILKFSIPFSTKTINIVKALFRVGFIKDFCILKNKTYRNGSLKSIHLSVFYYKNTSFFKNIKLLSTSTKKFNITYKALCLLSKSSKSSLFILSTSKGLLTSNQALKSKVGGFLLFAIM